METVAHARSGLALYQDTDVIVDVGGQDIKLIVMRNGEVRDFMLNTQCSAGKRLFPASHGTLVRRAGGRVRGTRIPG